MFNSPALPSPSPFIDSQPIVVPPTTSSPSPLPPRRSSRFTKPPNWLQDFESNIATHSTIFIPHLPKHIVSFANTQHMPTFQSFLATLTSTTTTPTKFFQAINYPSWVEAMNSELIALEKNNTWTITTLPPRRKAIDSKWLYKVKLNPDGSVDRLKARLVILGCKQRQGLDYRETFAPMAKMTTVRTLLAVADMKGWKTCQMDVSNAFLHGDLCEDVYMKLPLGYTTPGQPIVCPERENVYHKSDATKVCKLNKSLYGLKQAPHQWFAKLSSTLLSFGYSQSKVDYSLFTLQSGMAFTVILVYVDDLLITGNNDAQISRIKHLLSTQFHMKDLSPLRYFLGLEIDTTFHSIFVSQQKYTLNLIKEYGLQSARCLKLPPDPHIKLTADQGLPIPNPSVYRKLIG